MEPKMLLEEAKRCRARKARYWADDYIDSIELLYDEKGKCFSEIAEFFKDHGVDINWSGIRRAYHKRRKIKAQAEDMIEQAQNLIQ